MSRKVTGKILAFHKKEYHNLVFHMRELDMIQEYHNLVFRKMEWDRMEWDRMECHKCHLVYHNMRGMGRNNRFRLECSKYQMVCSRFQSVYSRSR